MSFLRLFCSWT